MNETKWDYPFTKTIRSQTKKTNKTLKSCMKDEKASKKGRISFNSRIISIYEAWRDYFNVLKHGC